MVRKFKSVALAGVLIVAATPSFADDVTTPFTDLMTTFTTDVNKGVAEFNPTEILTPKPIDAPAAAAPAVKKKKKHYAHHHMKKKMAKA